MQSTRTTADITSAIAAIRAQGFVVLRDLLTPSHLTNIRTALAPHLRREILGRNDFEGHLTERVYSLVGRGAVFAALAEHPDILAICDALLEPNYLLTASQAINIRPGETPQPFHTDDTFYRIARPRDAVSVSTIVAVDDFTDENGATQIVPGSHSWGDAEIGELLRHIDFATRPRDARHPEPERPRTRPLAERAVDVTMPAGAVIVFLGTLVHRGGANRSPQPRLALSNQYCQPWARPQENYFLSIARDQVRALSPRLQALLGYSIHPPFMGHANGVHPTKYL